MESTACRLFGVRHLSPAGAWHLKAFLDEVSPTVVLIEGLSDANELVKYLVHKKTVPPVALLAYTQTMPVRTLLSPFAEYSPEYQGILWAHTNNVPVAFIDLPSEKFLALERDNEEGQKEYWQWLSSLYTRIAKVSGEDDFDTYWERVFEHNLNNDVYRRAITEHSTKMRELSEEQEKTGDVKEYAMNLTREAFMRRRIGEYISDGHKPGEIVVVTGAYHLKGLDMNLPLMTDNEFEALPSVPTKLTLMPYSFFKLSTRAGYGAGNRAPAYFQLLWEAYPGNRSAGARSEPDSTANSAAQSVPVHEFRYCTGLARLLREEGNYRSPAETIEAVRLARTLASLHDGSSPALADLADAAAVIFGRGNKEVISQARAAIEIGTAIGELPEGASQTPIQDDFIRELERLKLSKYKTGVAQILDLDLRENRRAGNEETAFLDLERSFFLHRLETLGVNFAEYRAVRQDKSSWAEQWSLRWTPEAEIAIVESALRGETIELAVAFLFQERMQESESIAVAGSVIRDACICGMPESLEAGRSLLQGRAAQNTDFKEMANASFSLSQVISFGDLRRFSTEPLIPLLSQLFLRGTLTLEHASTCNNDAARQTLEGINELNQISLSHYEIVDEKLWLSVLSRIAGDDSKNPLLSGYTAAILLERAAISDEELSREVSRRLSPGMEADLAAYWFEGLALKNKYALLSRLTLWQQLDNYLSGLSAEEFPRALVFLRRAFGPFSRGEKNKIAEILGEVWQVDCGVTADAVGKPLSEEEEKKIDSLSDFDF